MSTEESAAAPAKTKSKVGKIIQDVENVVEAPFKFIGKEAGIIGKLFAKEAPAVQDDLKAVSGVIQIIKTEVTEAPEIVIYLIKKAYPNFTPDLLLSLLSTAANSLGLAEKLLAPNADGSPLTINQVIANYQTYASSIAPDQLAHKNFWTSLFNILGILVQPGVAWEKILTFGVYIYNTFIKKK